MQRIKIIVTSQRGQVILLSISVLAMLCLLWFTIWINIFPIDPAKEKKAEKITEIQKERAKMYQEGEK
ncbi:hypothetical protein [Bacillus rhizoplanae]|uniref:hypothetical protein n=1 Tax=Bacillus rhizoplanae TaxID=2880966 RepID=UPI003D1DBEFE